MKLRDCTSSIIGWRIGLAVAIWIGLNLYAAEDDPHLWLEEVESEEALAWAREISERDTAAIEAVPEFEVIQAKLLEIYQSRDKIPGPRFRGSMIYNFWQDEAHVRGIWRRASLEEYVKDTPDWETVIDLDQLAEDENENWVWKGATFMEPDFRLCMVALSRGGADAVERREFDPVAKAFVEGGFFLPEAKNRVSWKDRDTLWIGTDFGEGTLTHSGYPRFAREWRRGTPLEQAITVFEVSADEVSVTAWSDHTPEGRYDLVQVTPEFFRGTSYLRLDGRLVKLDLPEDARMLGFFKDHLLVRLRSDWLVGDHSYPQDALLAIPLDDFLAGSRDFELLFEPQERVSLDRVRSTVDRLLYTTLDNVRGRLYSLTLGEAGWTREPIDLPGLGTIGLGSCSDDDDSFFFTYTDYLTPSSLYLVEGNEPPKKVKSSPAWFEPEGMRIVQNEAVSKDGTRIPYFALLPKSFRADGTNPTLLTAYGGFEVSMVPRYSGSTGSAWVERGGVYVAANIRGGGEFGPEWHRAAMREKHQTNFDDFIAVAEDLIERGITSPRHLGIQGGSQGGLLVGGAFTQRPDLFEAVVCAVPLLDMKRYNKLLAGASWMGEYGNPDTEDWAFMKLWSPYQNLDPDTDYPQVFFWTNTRDDRVHPAHARKMVARMTAMGKPVLYYENTEGGHASGANLKQYAYTGALSYAYLWMMLR